MKSFWLFRSNLRSLEYYHSFKTLEEYKLKCHDFYILQGIYYLESNQIDEFIVWRLTPKNTNSYDIIININNKRFIQKFVNNLDECLKYKEKPHITFWRGGFKEYDDITKKYYKFFSPNSLYLGAGQRIYPNYGGKYDKILYEDERDINKSYKCISFYKTVNNNIFYPMENINKEYDICFISNFTQIKYKGQEDFIKEITKSKYLKSLKILHIGNNPEIGLKLCKNYDIKNIEFKGKLEREEINLYLNKSRIGFVWSNLKDGCPRVLTEIMSSGIPLIVRDTTRLLKYYRKISTVFTIKDSGLENTIKKILNNDSKENFSQSINNIKYLTFQNICDMNIKLWINNDNQQ